MDALHGFLADTLRTNIKELTQAEDKKGLAALLAVARQFLKDNNISANVTTNGPLASLTEGLPFMGDEFSEDDHTASKH